MTMFQQDWTIYRKTVDNNFLFHREAYATLHEFLANEVVRLIARLGGFLARKRDGEPGVKTIWLGMQRILDFAAGIRFCRELQAQGSCV